MNHLCVVVDYSEGYKSPYAFLRLKCPSIEYILNTFIEGTEGCINIESLNSSHTCSLSVTDVDALDIVDTTPAIFINEILITRNIVSTILQPTPTIRVTTHLLPTCTSTPVLTTCTCTTPSVIMPIGES